MTLEKVSFMLKRASIFLQNTKSINLLATESGATTDAQRNAVARHILAVAVITNVMQNNLSMLETILNSVKTDWPGREMYVIFLEIVREFSPDNNIREVTKKDALE